MEEIMRLAVLGSAVVFGATSVALAQEDLTEIDKPASELEQVLAEEVEFKAGTQEVRVVRVEMEPKTAAAWHTHPSPVFVYVAEGELVMEVEGQETKTIQAGEAVAEPLDARMRVLNTTDRPASVVVFQISPAEEEFLEGEN
jgi:quercetin dioxygenase-like cupin family protein